MKEQVAARVLFVITKSNWGGAQSYVYTLAEAVKARGIPVGVALGGTGAAGAASGALDERLRKSGIPTHFVASFARDIGIFRDIRALRELYELFVREEPTTLHLNSSKAGALGAIAGRLAGVPNIIFTAHGWPHREPRALIARAAIWAISWMTIVLSHTVIVVSEKDYRDAPVLFMRRKLVLIRNGISPFPLLSREEARTEIARVAPKALYASFWVMGAMGDLHPNKGFDILISAFIEAARTRPEIALIIIGEGEMRRELENLINEVGLAGRVYLVGFMPDGRRLLNAADIFVLPSRKEGLPFSLLEAGYANRPVIASATGGIPEVIDAHTGIGTKPGDANAIARALETLLDDTQKRAAYGEALRERVIRDYSEGRMIAATLSRYR